MNTKLNMFYTFPEYVARQLNGFEVLLSNSTGDDGANLMFNSHTSDTNYTYPVQLLDTMARYIRIKRYGILTMCEVIVEEGGTYNALTYTLLRQHVVLYINNALYILIHLLV